MSDVQIEIQEDLEAVLKKHQEVLMLTDEEVEGMPIAFINSIPFFKKFFFNRED